MSISNKLVIHRLKTLMGDESQNRAAKRACVSQATVGRLLNEQQSATVDLLEKIALAFDVHPSSFLLDDEESEFLNKFKKLNNDDKLKVLGYIGFAISQYSTQNRKLDHEFQIAPSTSIAAAVLRANALPVKGKKHPTDDEKPKLSRGRRQP